MLIDFTVSNYQSIKESQTFSFVSESRSEEKNVLFSLENDSIRLYPFSVIFGPNASGKSKFIYALEDLCDFVKDSYRYSEKDEIKAFKPFLLDESYKDVPASFELEYEINGSRYLYILEITKSEVLREELYLFTYNKRVSKTKVFIRRKGEPLYFSSKYSGLKKALESFLLPNQSLLSRSGNSSNDLLKLPYLFFEEKIIFYTRKNFFSSNVSFTTFLIEEDKNNNITKTILDFLKTADIQIEDLKIEHMNDFNDHELPRFDTVNNDVKFNEFINILMKLKPKLAHKLYNTDKLVYFDLEEQESTGTIKLYDLVSYILRSLIMGSVLVIDEFNNGLHPLIEKKIIDLFLDPEINTKNAQLLVTSHDTYILDSSNFKREQIWFTDKNKEGATELYSLNEFDKNVVRDYATYGKYYFEGRFNALPKISDFTLD